MYWVSSHSGYCFLSNCSSKRCILTILLISALKTYSLPPILPSSYFNYGVGIDASTYPGNNLKIITQALSEASDLAQAGLDACANFTQRPLNAFFPSKLQSANIAAGVYQRVLQRLRGSRKQIKVL